MNHHITRGLLAVAAAVVLPSAAAAQTPHHQHYEKPEGFDQPNATGQIAPRLQKLGTHTFKVTIASERAQLFINQGLNLAYGFNHAEAFRAFAEAARLDPQAPMAYWGQAWVLGPNINAPMNPDDEPKAYELVRKAMSLRSRGTPREQAYIEALAARYTGKADDRKAADKAFADAMEKVVQQFPDDLDAATIYAESLMDLRPWDYWTRDGKPQDGTEKLVAALESVIKRHQNHPGALHYWIHVWEPTDTPERAEAEADRLITLMPGAGHVVHMPGHIYHRVGRYADVVKANQMAIDADEDYIVQCRAQGIYPLGYYPHNVHFLWIGATLAGQSALAIEAADKTAKVIPHEALEEVPFLQGFLAVPYWARVKFQKWDAILAEKGPAHDTLFMRGVFSYARASALVGKGRLSEAEQELQKLKAIVADPKLVDEPASFSANNAAVILRIAPEVVAGQIAAKKKDFDRALLHLERAVRYEDALIYTEPADWHSPVRLELGAALREAGRHDEAEIVYWEDLKRNPENGWALHGLMEALKAQGKTDQAAEIERRFTKAWAGADFKLGRAAMTTN
jgi:tetratricopeptide (TPR) repeat protein